jgi:hypothetical protein
MGATMKKNLGIFFFIILFLTQCTFFAPKGKIIYNEDFFGEKPVIINLVDMSKDSIFFPLSHQPSVVDMKGTLYLFRPSFEYFAWSNSGKSVAFPCLPEDDINLTVCVWSSDFIALKDRHPSQYPKSFPLSPTQIASYPEALIQNISWSPNDQFIIATARWQPESPCLIYLKSEKVECGPYGLFWDGFSEDARQVLAGAFVIEWSPTDSTKMALPLRKNWLSVTEDGKTIVGGENHDYFVGLPTGDYPDGIYLVDLDSKILHPVWLSPENVEIDSRNKLLWNPNGKYLTFTYVNFDENYTVASVGVNGKNFTSLFDGNDVISQIQGSIPENFRYGRLKIFLNSWSSNGRYLLFEINLARDQKAKQTKDSINADYLLGGFLYDTKNQQIYSLMEFLPTNYSNQRLRFDWAD